MYFGLSMLYCVEVSEAMDMPFMKHVLALPDHTYKALFERVSFRNRDMGIFVEGLKKWRE